jgi:hypothetical protein
LTTLPVVCRCGSSAGIRAVSIIRAGTGRLRLDGRRGGRGDRIADAVAYQVGPAHHAALRDGGSPAATLAAAIEQAAKSEPDPAALVCFGAGW